MVFGQANSCINVVFSWCSWNIIVQMPDGTVLEPPHSLKLADECTLDEVINLSTYILPFASFRTITGFTF